MTQTYTTDAVRKVGTNENLLCIVQELCSVCGNLNGKEIQERRARCGHAADSPCCAAEAKATCKISHTQTVPKIKFANRHILEEFLRSS